ncbi:MAG: hypothetical protein ACREOG_09230, partial [Gemmatimonadaceae bacterium]
QGRTLEPSPFRVAVMTGGLTPRSAVIEDALGSGDTRLGAGPAFGLDLQYQAFGPASLYASGAVAFGTLHHGTNLGVAVRGTTSDAIVYAGTGGLVIDWMRDAALRPLVRIGGGLKGYSFSADGAEGFITPTGDFGLGFRAGSGAVELGAEVRFLLSTFDQAKLPTRGIVAQDQQQMDVLFGISVTVRP